VVPAHKPRPGIELQGNLSYRTTRSDGVGGTVTQGYAMQRGSTSLLVREPVTQWDDGDQETTLLCTRGTDISNCAAAVKLAPQYYLSLESCQAAVAAEHRRPG
jgi:hypothetical protein